MRPYTPSMTPITSNYQNSSSWAASTITSQVRPPLTGAVSQVGFGTCEPWPLGACAEPAWFCLQSCRGLFTGFCLHLCCCSFPATDNELSPFYHSDEQRARLGAAAASAPAIDAAAVCKQRLLEYKEAVAEGWAQQEALGTPASAHGSSAAGGSAGVIVLADVERHAVPVPAAELERFKQLKADLVDEAKYYRLKGMS